MEKKEYPIRQLVNWYFGNYCSRKCFDTEERLFDHQQKLMDFAEQNKNLKMTDADFLQFFNEHMIVCTLQDSFKKKMVSWKLFEKLKDTPNYDSDKIIVEHNTIKMTDGLLEKPVCCALCKKLRIYP